MLGFIAFLLISRLVRRLHFRKLHHLSLWQQRRSLFVAGCHWIAKGVRAISDVKARRPRSSTPDGKCVSERPYWNGAAVRWLRPQMQEATADTWLAEEPAWVCRWCMPSWGTWAMRSTFARP